MRDDAGAQAGALTLGDSHLPSRVLRQALRKFQGRRVLAADDGANRSKLFSCIDHG